ncbi:twitching motility protein PilT [Scytonema hofmannii PCC 7110]|uniref:Twitching motility protein PilT n=1 Tax=Scytonema hofmannii PCC 7110 TaxID=128403 RepID=A0A139XBS0_9CYAN|nr:type II toxin-antitoxin system VapC family toxin [Scytonema hofmannii]KYC42141.1 twitching motility protein PilT [Scytonema hofmannii PCC 7110]
MSNYVLDASVILALLNNEPGSEIVLNVLTTAVISSVNLSEVVAKLADSGMPEVEVREVISTLGLEIINFDTEMAYRAGMLRPLTRSAGLSFGDRACLTLGKSLDLPILTTDRTWADLNLGINVRVIR